jgi:diphosphomevalonate decarboxylase
VRFEEKYKKEAFRLIQRNRAEGFVAWRSPSNIALIKYWGKHGKQLPQNPSLSFTLDKSFTETKVDYKYRGNKGKRRLNFNFEKRPNDAFALRVDDYLNTASEYLPFLRQFDFTIDSHNSFPHSSGIASSASSMSALALCLVSMEQALFGTPGDAKSFYQKASFLSRLGSGSASRSVYDGFVVWGKHKNIKGSTDEFAIKPDQKISPKFGNLRDAILITSTVKKKVSSSAGHQLMNGHLFAAQRYQQARNNLGRLIEALRTGGEQEFIQIVENEALTLHAMMMTSADGFTLLNENSWNIIERIRQFRRDKNVFITFTLDAGPNIHLIYTDKLKKQIVHFIEKDLLQYCENANWIDDKSGKGPIKLS